MKPTLVLLLLLTACGDGSATLPEEPTPSGAPLTAFTTAELDALVEQRCAGCHSYGGTVNGAATPLHLAGASFGELTVGRAPSASSDCGHSQFTQIVAPGQSASSLLYRKVAGTADCGEPMPPGYGAGLSADDTVRLGLYIDQLPR